MASVQVMEETASPATVGQWLDTLESADRASMVRVLEEVSLEPGQAGWQDTYGEWVRHGGVIDTGDYRDIGRALEREGVQVVMVHDPEEGWAGFQAEATVDGGEFLLVQFHSIEEVSLTRQGFSGPEQVLGVVQLFEEAMDAVTARAASLGQGAQG